MCSASNVSPVFVYGALRSGTTLLRLMLLSHPQLQSPGEADFLFDHIDQQSGGDWKYNRETLSRDRIFRAKEIDLPRDIDGQDLARDLVAQMAAKEPGRLCLSLHRAAPRMAALFPDAKIVHLLRDPRDVARSSIGMGWSGNSYFGVGHWISTETQWDDASLPEAEVLTVYYEELMADLEGELGRICGFLGLAFDPAMLRYFENSTYGPPDPGIAQKWKTKASAREVALIEGRVGPLLEARNYVPAGAPAIPGVFERLRLVTQHRWKRWRHNIDRYGLSLFVGYHVARIAGLKRLEKRFHDQQEAIQIANLK